MRRFRAHLIDLSKILSRKGIYRFLSNEFSSIKPPELVLMVGSNGPIYDLLHSYQKKNRFRITTFDIDETKNPDVKGDICTYDFDGLEYDYVVMGEVLEHLHSPQVAIDNIYRILRPGGRLIMTVPFIFPIHERPYNYYRYTRYGLEYLLRNFRELVVKERNTWAEAIAVLFVRHVMEKNVASRLAAPIFILAAFLSIPAVLLLGHLIKSDFVTSGYLVSAKKAA